MEFWLLTGKPEHWEIGLQHNKWGLTEKFKNVWQRVSNGNILFLYATRPVKGIIGIARVQSKLEEYTTIWPEGVWPYRFVYSNVYILPTDKWEHDAVNILPIVNGLLQNGISNLRRELVEKILSEITKKWKTNFSIQYFSSRNEYDLVTPSTNNITALTNIPTLNEHDKVKQMLLEMGHLEGFTVNEEYSITNTRERIDVVWRKTSASVPSHAFEVHIGGNLHQAMSKLKHANELWNSRIYVVSREENLSMISTLLNGAFYEIKGKLRILTVDKIEKFYKLQKEYHKCKEEIGI
ncbi:MAG: hypothetical protein RMJ59_06050 [Candidatus Nitrosocaldus sp.]|nr:hypothetical protein [Candidatus Nitrosocaldus sp.]MDW8000950.1 hypothetical protein [Candidatus Nitrosocaldus sp.]MDW8275924.1 hypothetical protein [Candidatus Nitrosocaldus sp.]